MKRLLAPLILTLALAACSAPGGQQAANDRPGVTPVAATPTPGFDAPAPFGQTVTFPSGVEVSVAALSFGPPAKNVGVVGTGNQAVFSLTVSNKSGARIDASKTSWPKVAYGANQEPATPISNANITALLAGDSKTDQFSRFIPAADGGNVRVQVPDPDGGKAAIFEGSVGG